MIRNTIQISIAVTIFAVASCFCGPVQAASISSNSYYTWGISGDDVVIPGGSIITEAVLTIHDITNWDNNLDIHLIDNPPLDFVTNDDSASEGDFFEGFKGMLTRRQSQQNLVDGDLVIRFSEIDDDDSWAWDVFKPPFRFTLADSTERSYTSSLLELIDYVGNSTPFGIGFDYDGSGDIDYQNITLDLTIKSYNGQQSQSVISFETNESGGPANRSPISNAGSDQNVTDTNYNGSEQISLNGSGSSDPDGNISTYVWREGASEIATGVNPTVTLGVGTHTITLTVTDSGGLSDTDTVIITVNSPANRSPIANAGADQTVTDTDGNGSEQVSLNGSGSTDPDENISTHVWTEDAGFIAIGVNPTVTLGVGTHTITLRVTDSDGLSDTDTVVITVNSPVNRSPIANAGSDQTVTDTDGNGSEQISLNGSGSTDPDGNISIYVWTEDASMVAVGVNPTVILGVGTHTITLRVTDSEGLSDTNTVVITINSPPFGESLTGHWTMDDNSSNPVVIDSSGSGNNGISNSSTSSMHTNGFIDGALSFNGSSNYINLGSANALDNLPSDDFSVSAWIYDTSSGGKRTIAGAYIGGNAGWLLRTYGSGSDAYVSFWAGHSTAAASYATVEGSLTTNSWHHIVAAWDASSLTCRIYIDGYEASYSTENSGSGSYISDAAFDKEIGRMAYSGGIQYFEGAIDDVKAFEKVLSQQDINELYAEGIDYEPSNSYPIANAGSFQIVNDTDDNGSEQISLDGSGSTDPDENISTYVWTESSSEIATGINPTVTLEIGTHTITLTVTDSEGLSDTSTVTININPPVGEGLVGYWSLDDNSANTVITDSSGNDNTGILSKTTSSMHINGVLDGALYFNGTSDYINLGNPSSLNNLPSHDFMISAWIYDSSVAGKRTIAGVYSGGDAGWLLRTHGKGSARYISFWAGHSVAAASYATVEGTLTTNSWHHIVAAWNASSLTCRIYIDGYETSYSSRTAGSGSYNDDVAFDKEIGRMAYLGGKQFFRGGIDDVMISNELISASEIEQMHHSVMYAGYWSMDDDSANFNVTDNSGNGNTGISTQTTSMLHTNGVLNSALYFDGTSDYINLGNSSSINNLPSHDFTISAWIYDTSVGSKRTIAGVYTGGAAGWLLRSHGSGSNGFISFWAGHSSNSASYVTVPGSLTPNRWHHIVVAWDATNGTCRIYIDGNVPGYSKEQSGVGSYNSDATFDKEIGRMAYLGGIQFFEGAIDDVKIFNNTLSEDTIGNL